MSEAQIAQITAMGFTENAAKRGMRRGGGDVGRAIEWIMMHMEDEDLNAPLPEPAPQPAAPPPAPARVEDGGGGGGRALQPGDGHDQDEGEEEDEDEVEEEGEEEEDVWEQAMDPSSGREYYYNRASGDSRWTRPPALGGDADADDPLAGLMARLGGRPGGPPRSSATPRRVRLAADDDPSVVMICDMGFSLNAAKKALHFSGNDPMRAVDWIMVRMGDPTLNEEFDPNYDPADSLVSAIKSLAPNLEERLESLNTEVLMSGGGEPGTGSPLDNPASQMTRAGAMRERRDGGGGLGGGDDARTQVLREWGCRTLSNFRDRGNRRLDTFVRQEKTIVVLVGLVEAGSDRRVNEEVISSLNALAKSSGEVRRAILGAGGLQKILRVAASEADAMSTTLTEQALKLATEVARSLRPPQHNVSDTRPCLCELLTSSTELRVHLKVLELCQAIVTSCGGTAEGYVGGLVEEAGRCLPHFLLSAIREQSDACGAACELLGTLCRADAAVLLTFVEEGLLAVLVGAVSCSAARSISSICALACVVIEQLHPSDSGNVAVGDEIEVAIDKPSATAQLSGPIFLNGHPHPQLEPGVRVEHTELGGGSLAGWKHEGHRKGDTGGGLQSDNYCRIHFDKKHQSGWNVSVSDVCFAGGPKYARAHVVCDKLDGTYVVEWCSPCELNVVVKAADIKACTGIVRKGARVRAKKRPLGFANFSGGSLYYDATVISCGSQHLHVSYDDEDRDDPELPLNMLEPGTGTVPQARGAATALELNAAVLESRSAFARDLLPQLLHRLGELSQNSKAVLEATVLLADKLGESELSLGDTTQLIVRLSQTVQTVLTERQSLSALLFAVRLAGAALRLRPEVSIGILARFGVVESVRSLHGSDGAKLEQTPSSGTKLQVVVSASKYLLENMESGLGEASEVHCTTLEPLAERVAAGDAAAVKDFAALLQRMDGITQYEFEKAAFVESLLSLVSSGDTATLRSVGKQGLARCVGLIQGVLSAHENLPLFASNVSLSQLSRPVKLQFRKADKSMCTDISEAIQADPIVRAEQLETWVLQRSMCTDPLYIAYCKDLVGCQIKIKATVSLSRGILPNEWCRADVITFDEPTGRHILFFGHDSTTLTMSLQAINHKVVRGRFESKTINLATLCKSLHLMTQEAASKQVMVLPMLVKRLKELESAPTSTKLKILQSSDQIVQDLTGLPGGEDVIKAVGFRACKDSYEMIVEDARHIRICRDQLVWSLQNIPTMAAEQKATPTLGHEYVPFGAGKYSMCVRCGMSGPSSQSGPDYCKKCMLCRVCCSKSTKCASDFDCCLPSNVPVVFDMDHCGTSVKVEDDNKIVSFSGHSSILLAQPVELQSGTWYVEILCMSGGNALVGVATEDYDVNTYLGDAVGGCGVFARGGVRVDGNWERVTYPTPTEKGFKDGDMLRIELDMDARTMLMCKNGVPVHEHDVPAGSRFALGGSSGGKFR
jgi:hypothetical protein